MRVKGAITKRLDKSSPPSSKGSKKVSYIGRLQ